MPGTGKDKQTTPETGLDKMIIDNQEIFDLEKIPGTGPDVEPTAAQPAPGVSARDDQEELDEKKLSDEDEKKKKELRFKTHEEAEEGYKEKQARVTKVEQENADLRQKVSESEQELTRLKEKEEAEKEESKRIVVEKKILEFSQKRHEETLKEIEDLDPEDPEHSAKVATLWATLGADVRKFEKEAADAPLEEPAKEPDDKDKGKKAGEEDSAAAKTPKAPPTDDSAVKTDAEAEAEARKYVEDRVKAAGRDFTNPVLQRAAIFTPLTNEAGAEMSLDEQIDWSIKEADKFTSAAKAEGIDPEDPVYLHMVFKAPDKSDKGEDLSLDDQMKYAIEKTKEHKAAEKARILQEANLPLPTGASRHADASKGKPEQGISFGDAIDKATESRRL